MKDYRIQIKVRNANILRLMENRGIKTVAELCRLTSTSQQTIGNILNLKLSPVFTGRANTGDWLPCVVKLCEFFGKLPADLFSQEQMTPLAKNAGSTDVGFEEITNLIGGYSEDPSALLEIKDRDKMLSNALETLTDREQEIINLRHGLNGEAHTLKEVGMLLGVTGARIREIEARALRKLRHPSRWDKKFEQEYLS